MGHGASKKFSFAESSTENSTEDLHDVFSLKVIRPSSFGLKDVELLETIGTGNFSRVRLARCIEDKKYFAMKILKKGKVARSKQIKHVLDEINILSHLRCVFAVELYYTYIYCLYELVKLPFFLDMQCFKTN